MKLLKFSRSNRTHVLAVGVLLLMAVFVVRLFDIQILQHDYFASLANSEQIRQLDLPAKRGEIYMMSGDTPTKVVLNETVYTVWADPHVLIDANAVTAVVTRAVGDKAVSNIAELLADADSRYKVLAREVTSAEANMIKEEHIYGVGFTAGIKRVYPEGQLASQVLGFVNADGVGQYGVEGALDDELKGTDGLLKTVVDVRDVPLTIGSSYVNIPAQDGADIVLSIDRSVQNKAEEVLLEQLKKIGDTATGSMLVMDPNTGKILAMANYPTYNPEEINKVTDLAAFNNQTISDPYEPASVMKTVAFATAIDQGVITADTTYENKGWIQVEDRVINNASKPAALMGEITMQTALNWSFNTGAVTAAEQLSQQENTIDSNARNIMYEYYHNRLHLGQRTGIELQGEAQGTVVSPTDVQGNAVRYANMTFGQGLNVTSLQTAAAFSALINGGVYHPPTVVAGTMNDGVFVEAEAKQTNQAISASSSKEIREMIHVARQQFGYNNADPKGYYIGGKTGTAQTIENGQYTFDQQTGTYAGFGGSSSDAPAYVIVTHVFMKDTQLGGYDAKTVFDPMSNWMIDYLKLAPKA